MQLARTLPQGHKGQSSPRSPLLSDAGMILPDFGDNHLRSESPHPHFERPPSLPTLDAVYGHSRSSSLAGTVPILDSVPANRRRSSQPSRFTSVSSGSHSNSSLSTLRKMSAPEGICNDALASSPTAHDALPRSTWDEDDRRISVASSSVLSEDFENWPGFDSHGGFDDSGVDLEDQEDHHHSPSTKNNQGDEAGAERTPGGRTSGSSDDEDDPYSSAALSRRAEIILANAKKRLNVMEGNLRGARESLVVSPTSPPRTRSSSELSQHISAARDRDRRLYAGMGPIPPRIHSYRTPLSSSTNSSAGHARGVSETSIPLPFSSTYMTKTPASKRASSAMGAARSSWLQEGYGNGRFPVKESRSYDNIRDPRASGQRTPVRSTSRSSKSALSLATLREDDSTPTLHRSTSAASDLREQVNDLKGRISSLKQRAQDDRLRRRSTQSLRSPSPFTSAETWNSSPDAHRTDNRQSPRAPATGLGITTDPPIRNTHLYVYKDEYMNGPMSARTTTSQIEGERLLLSGEGQDEFDEPPLPTRHFGAQPSLREGPGTLKKSQDVEKTEDLDDDDEPEVVGDSVYEDAVYEMPITARHEDRVDAFDYEHFFLHSAMGTYSLESRRSSTSSTSSTATTRPTTAINDNSTPSKSQQRNSMHARNASADSVSTIATFATAAERQNDDDDENEQMDQFSQQLLSNQQSTTPRPGITSLRTDSAINLRRGNGSSPTASSVSRGSSSPGDLVSGLRTSKLFSTLTEAPRDEPRLALNEEDKQLIYSLAASFQHVCSSLQNTYGEQYERKAWRRRLEEARRILAGEDAEDDPSF
ncbi:hypothetical protein P153DRAFT_286715 [Dothidotthia symphoricarpi CBS 119687]|uniref:Uncharacterized protein n=1 Tax=Dothidotthia symphoricarpi CBS 119687 TaxID=1392245 RepID=A0A6A6AIY7_9PLEO|nr:uncharacterized protein P153DRAFT_286715 [Dothidotthia symphoricarpi CBS 119687]KAF2131770.1 hypothetical protein P153DRAFT_286715 [Dothidotthia symphoricarpi CBS 119687]